MVNKGERRKKFTAVAGYLSKPDAPNDLWCADFKGQFRMKNQEYCFPLTISDFKSRYLISCEALNGTAEEPCYSVFDEAFKDHGLPNAIRTDNGIPFASGNSLWGMTKLSIWWIRLGIKIERIEPGNPQQNGRHERMHRTLKLEATKPPRSNLLQQQERFYGFRQEFNHERPHQALDMKCPADVYQKSSRSYEGVKEITYPDCERNILVSNCGRVCMKKGKIHVSQAFATSRSDYRKSMTVSGPFGLWIMNLATSTNSA